MNFSLLSLRKLFRSGDTLSDAVIRQIVLQTGMNEAAIDSILLQDGHAIVALQIDPQDSAAAEPVRQHIEQRILSLRGAQSAKVILTAQRSETKPSPHTQSAVPQKPFAPDVKHIIAVASGKGGVGKSTVAVNLAVALAQSGLAVGLLDTDIYGPSVPTLLGIADQKPVQEQDYLLPITAHGITAMSMGFLTNANTPLIWRGPMVQSAVQQLLRDVKWGALDVLVLDMPPGTGDAQLTVAQKVPLKGAIIVSTPQDIALLDAVKAVEMFRKVNVPIIGLVENMSVFCCPNCGHHSPVFGQGGARDKAQEMHVSVLGDIPLEPMIRAQSDAGIPPVIAAPDSATAQNFQTIAQAVWQSLGL